MTKVEREVVFNSENGQKEMTGVRHSDDDVKKKVIDCVFKLGQLNNIPEKYVEKNSDPTIYLNVPKIKVFKFLE